MTITEHDADKQQAELRKIMAEQRIPFQDAVDIYIKRKYYNVPTVVLSQGDK